MPWPKSSVPKFGGWDKSEDVSYSVVFDKARAEKERFLHVSDNELSPDQIFYKNSREDAARKTLFPDKARAGRERDSPNSEQDKMFVGGEGYLPKSEQDKMSARTHQNILKNPEAIAGRRSASHAPSYNTSFPHGDPSRPPLQNRATKGSTFLNERQHADQADRGFHERLQARSINAPGRSMYALNPPTAKMRSSQAVLEASRIAEMQRKHAVPKFGDWESGDAFTAEFNKARNEKNSNRASRNALHPSVKAGFPSQPDEDLYKSSEISGGSAERKKRLPRWLRMLCGSGGAPQ